MFYLTEMAEYRAVVPALGALWNGFEQLGRKSLRWSKDDKKITSITFVCIVFHLMIFFFLSFFFSGDHLFCLNSGPLTFSPVGSCLKKKNSLHPVHFCYISIFSVLESSLDRGYHAEQNRTFFLPFLQFRTCSFAQGITEYADSLFWLGTSTSYSCMKSEPSHRLREGFNSPTSFIPWRKSEINFSPSAKLFSLKISVEHLF